MEKINNNNELEIMRSQMTTFKKQLEQQEISTAVLWLNR